MCSVLLALLFKCFSDVRPGALIAYRHGLRASEGWPCAGTT
jgi:hypothetical protein